MPADALPRRATLPPSGEFLKRQLTLTTLLVLVCHALLLWGLPNWWQQDHPSHPNESFITRMIIPAPPAPAPPAEATPPPPVPPEA